MTGLHLHLALARRVCAGIVFVLAAAVGLGGTAEARPVDQGFIHEEVALTTENYCGVPGLTVTEQAVFDGRFLFNLRRPGTAPYYQERVKATIVVTNEDGDSVKLVYGVLSKDLKITVNDDGTLTIMVLETGPGDLYDSSGKAKARNPQVRFEILVDYGG